MKQYKTLTGLLGKRERWTQGARARNADGGGCDPLSPNGGCDPLSPNARSFCLSGAAEHISGGHFRTKAALKFSIAEAIAIEFPKSPYRYCIASFNDAQGRKHADIVRVCKRADKIYRERRKQRCT